jgi:predicted negative regulator of RcsB-dependent stress response
VARYKRITRKEDIKGPDEFVGFWTKAYYWADENKEVLLQSAVGLLLAVFIVAGFFSYRQHREATASRELFNILKDAPKKDDPASNETLAKLETSLASYQEKYGSTHSGRVSLLYRANYLYQSKKYDQAEKLFKEAMEGKNDFVAQLAVLGLATTYENQGKYDAVLSLLDKARKDSFFEEDMDYMTAHNMELAKNNTGALKEYKQFQDKYPGSRKLNSVKESVARLS